MCSHTNIKLQQDHKMIQQYLTATRSCSDQSTLWLQFLWDHSETWQALTRHNLEQ